MKNEKPKIHIKKQNRGKFTRYCKGLGFNGVTNECIRIGKSSKSPSVRKQAVFAQNFRNRGGKK
jgi:hypothetical protein